MCGKFPTSFMDCNHFNINKLNAFRIYLLTIGSEYFRIGLEYSPMSVCWTEVTIITGFLKTEGSQ